MNLCRKNVVAGGVTNRNCCHRHRDCDDMEDTLSDCEMEDVTGGDDCPERECDCDEDIGSQRRRMIERAIRMLRQNVAGANSEMTQLHAYLYQIAVLRCGNEEVTCALEGIAADEQKHLRSFMDALMRLGADPGLFTENATCNPTYWSARHVNRTRSLRGILIANIKAEQQAIERYREQSDSVQIPWLAALLREVMEDECSHKDTLTRLLRNNCGED